MSGPTGQVQVKPVAGGEKLPVPTIEVEAASLARRVTWVFGENFTCKCEKCVLVRQARALLRRLGKE